MNLDNTFIAESEEVVKKSEKPRITLTSKGNS